MEGNSLIMTDKQILLAVISCMLRQDTSVTAESDKTVVTIEIPSVMKFVQENAKTLAFAKETSMDEGAVGMLLKTMLSKWEKEQGL